MEHINTETSIVAKNGCFEQNMISMDAEIVIGSKAIFRRFIERTVALICILALGGIAPVGMTAAQAAVGKPEKTSLKFKLLKVR